MLFDRVSITTLFFPDLKNSWCIFFTFFFFLTLMGLPALCRLSLVAVSEGYSLFVVVQEFLIMVPRLQAPGLSPQ